MDALSNRGLALVGLGRFNDAIPCIENAISLTPDAPDLHFNLGTALDELWRYDEAAASYSTMNGRHTSELLTGDLGPMAAFERGIRSAEASYREAVLVDPGQSWLAQRPNKTKLNCWSVVMNSQGHQLSHIHPSGWLSGVYYPRLPDVVDDNDPKHEGWIEFGRTTDNYSGKKDPDVRMYKPREGLMVLFPSYFYHRTIPFHSDQLRFSIAFDICHAD